MEKIHHLSKAVALIRIWNTKQFLNCSIIKHLKMLSVDISALFFCHVLAAHSSTWILLFTILQFDDFWQFLMPFVFDKGHEICHYTLREDMLLEEFMDR